MRGKFEIKMHKHRVIESPGKSGSLSFVFPLTSISILQTLGAFVCRLRLNSRSMHRDSKNIEQLAPISASDGVTAAVFQDRGIKR